MIRALIAASLLTATAAGAAAAATATPASDRLVANAAWWEKLVVTVGGDGTAPACLYESSHAPGMQQACSVDRNGAEEPADVTAKATSITFERRFVPGAIPDAGEVTAGDTLLGKSVITLAIDGNGLVTGCKLMMSDGDVTPDYGCKEASAERFATAAPATGAATTAGTMTILVYAHEEHYA